MKKNALFSTIMSLFKILAKCKQLYNKEKFFLNFLKNFLKRKFSINFFLINALGLASGFLRALNFKHIQLFNSLIVF